METDHSQAYDAKYENQVDVKEVGDAECKAKDDAYNARPLPVYACNYQPDLEPWGFIATY